MRKEVRKALLIPYTFVLMNWAAVVGLYYFARGRKDVWVKPGTPQLSPGEKTGHGASRL